MNTPVKTNFDGYFRKFVKDYVIFFGIIVLFIVFSITSKYFFDYNNFSNILVQSSTTAMVAIGQALCVISGGFDLSIGQNVCMTSGIGTVLMVNSGVEVWLALAISLILGTIVGLCNGSLIALLNIPPFVATLGLQSVCKGISKLVTDAKSIAPLPDDVGFLGRGFIGSVPFSVIVMILMFIAFALIMRKTKLGRYIYAIGGNKEASFFAGINVKKYTIFTYMISGVLSATAGIFLMSRLNSWAITNGNLYEFDAITGSVIGGISMMGGKGNVIQALFGVIFLLTFFNGMNMLNVNPFIQDVLKGVVLLLAVVLDAFRNRSKG